METTRLSSKGQLVIPQAIRMAHQWPAGMEFKVIDTGKGILLTPLKRFEPTTIEDLVGCLRYKGPRKSLKDMEKGIAKGARKHKDDRD